MAAVFAPTWLPEGYAERKADSGDDTSFRTYGNADGQAIYFMYSFGSDATSLFLVSDDMTAEKTAVGTLEAEFYRDADPQNANVLVWRSESGEILFFISAPLSKDVMVKIAESIEPIA